MKNKNHNKNISEIDNKEITQNDEDLRLNATINEFKDINLKKIFIKKQLVVNDDKKLKNENKVPIINNDLKLYKHVQVRKKMNPQLSSLLSPTTNNIIHKTKTITGNFLIGDNYIQTTENKDKILAKINIKKENKYKSLMNTIHVKKKNMENSNRNENNKDKTKNNYSFSQMNKTLKNKNNEFFNYIKKKVYIQGKIRNMTNKNKNINKNVNNIKKNDKISINIENHTKSAEKNNRNADILNKYSNYTRTEENSKIFLNNYKSKNTYLLFPRKKDNISKTIHPDQKKFKKRHKTEIMSHHYQNTDTTITKDNYDNNSNNNININNLTQSINDKVDEKDNKEKRRYIYINRKIRYSKNDTNSNIINKEDTKIKFINKPTKIMEIKVENGNSIKSHSLSKDNSSSNRFSFIGKKNNIIKEMNNNNIKLKIKPCLTNEFYYKNNKTKSTNNIKPFQTLQYLVHKASEIEELGDSFGKFYLTGPISARNIQNKRNLDKFEKNKHLSESYNKIKTLSDFDDPNNSLINNTFIKKRIYSNINSEEKKHYRKYNNFYNTEKECISYPNKIVNNNTFNTTVNFYKINQIPTDMSKSAIGIKSFISKIKNKNKLEHKRTNSDSPTYSTILEHMMNNTGKKINNKNAQENDNNTSSSFSNNSYIKVDTKEDNQHKEYKIDLEILYILEAKLKCVLNKINNYNICYNECFDWINYYFSCNFYEKEIDMFKLNHNKNNIIYYIKIELLCYFLCYDVSFNKNFNQAGILFKTIFNLLHTNFLILVTFIINGNNKVDEENNDNLCLNRLNEIIKKDLKIKLNSQDMNENSILLLISNNFKEINNYYKMIIDNLYSYYYSINDDSNINKSINKFPNCLSLDINSMTTIQKLNIISLFFFDTYRLSNNYNIEDLKNFFEIYLYKSKEIESLVLYNNTLSLNNNNKYNNNNNQNLLYNNNNNYANNQINQNNYYNNMFINDYYLPPIKSYYKYTLVLDLDETLVYYQKDINLLNNNFNNNKNTLIFRPGLFDFLYKMKPLYELVLFSFGTKDYVDSILSIIEKKEKIFEYVLYRQHATYEKGDYVKNLALLGRDLKKIIIVDDIQHVFKLQKNNGICIKAFYGDVISDRNTLKLLGKILEKIRFDAEENDGDITKSLLKQKNLIFTHITTNLEC